MTLRVVVVGGGIAGLAAAWHLAREAAARRVDLECTVLEASPRWGGKIRTDRVDAAPSAGGAASGGAVSGRARSGDAGRRGAGSRGAVSGGAVSGGATFLVEAGPDSFLTRKPWALELVRELGLEGELLGMDPVAPATFIWRGGRPLPIPEGMRLLVPTRWGPFLRSPLFSWAGKARVAAERFIPPRQASPGEDESLASFVRRRFGAEMLDRIGEPLMAGIHGSDPERQSMLATFPDYLASEARHGSLLRAARAGRAGQPKRSSASGASAPRGASGHPDASSLRGASPRPATSPPREASARPGTSSDGEAAAGHAVSPRGGDPAAPASASPFVTLAGGMQELVNRLVERLSAMGEGRVRLRTGARAVRIAPAALVPAEPSGGFEGQRGDGGIGAELSTGSRPPAWPAESRLHPASPHCLVELDDGTSLPADAVVVATPAPEAARLLRGAAPDAATALAGIRHGASGTASLAFRESDVRRPIPGYGLLLPASEGRSINAVTVMSRKFPGRAPEGFVLFRAFFGGWRTPEMMKRDERDLLRVVRGELRELLGVSGDPLFERVHRYEVGNPQFDVGHLERVAEAERALPPWLRLAGAPYGGVGIPDCVRGAREAAERILEALDPRGAQ